MAPYPSTSVEMRGEEMGGAGVGLLVAELTEPADAHSHTTVVLEPRLSIRESTVGRNDTVLPSTGAERRPAHDA